MTISSYNQKEDEGEKEERDRERVGEKQTLAFTKLEHIIHPCIPTLHLVVSCPQDGSVWDFERATALPRELLPPILSDATGNPGRFICGMLRAVDSKASVETHWEAVF